ncbi:MAG: ribokinase [Kiritimatiellae bacterium]|nr:ribokinase [Kiritimatiellia bacterium]
MDRIVVLGSTNTDMVITADHLPVPGETICDGSFKMHPGGKGANQAVAVARLSAEPGACEFIAKVGDDVFGRETGERLRRDGIAANLIVDPVNASGTALILVDSKGQNVISVALGANGALSEDDISPYMDDIRAAKVLLMQLETPVPTVAAAAACAYAAGTTVVLNPAPAAKLPRELLANVDWITPNETEAEILTGIKVTDGASARQAADALRALGVGHVVITMGSKGCYSADTDEVYPCRPVKAVDCVAAGDTFNGGFVVALAEGKSVAEAIEFGQKAAAISVTRVGAQPSVPYRGEIA